MYVWPGSTCFHLHPSAQTKEAYSEVHQLHQSNERAARKFFMFFYLPGVSRHSFWSVGMRCLWEELKCPTREIGKGTSESHNFFFSFAFWGEIMGKAYHFPPSNVAHFSLSIIPFSNRNILLTLFNLGCFLYQHRNPGRGVFQKELIFLYHVNDHIDFSFHLISTSVYWEIYW